MGCSTSSPPIGQNKVPVRFIVRCETPPLEEIAIIEPVLSIASTKPNLLNVQITSVKGVGGGNFQQKRERRRSVSSECMSESFSSPFVPQVFPKTAAQVATIEPIRQKCPLFTHLDDIQWGIILNAMKLLTIKKDQLAIRQGDDGDYFYVIDAGHVDIFISPKPPASIPLNVVHLDKPEFPPVIIDSVDDLGKRVIPAPWGPGVWFGELALMYQQPRAASCLAIEPCSLWAIDRATFRHVLLRTTNQKRQLYTETLKSIKILETLTPYERHTVADAVVQVTFKSGQVIIKEGEIGDDFYMIEDGTVECFQTHGGVQQKVNVLTKGAYFGELALIADIPRQATVKADGKVLAVKLDRACFTRLFGPLTHLMMDRAIDAYSDKNTLESCKDLLHQFETDRDRKDPMSTINDSDVSQFTI